MNEPLHKQKELLWQALIDYKGQADQRDDITILSVKL